MKSALKNAIRKQRKQQRRRRQQLTIDDLHTQGQLSLTDPLEWVNLIAERVGYAHYQARKNDTELSTQDKHLLIAGIVREVQEEILNAPEVLAFYLSRHEASSMQQAFDNYLHTTRQYVPEPAVVSDESDGAGEST